MKSEVRVQRLPRLRRRQVLVVANAHASGVRPDLVGAVEAELARWGATGPTLVTESSEEWVEALESAGERRVVLVGGDGTVHAAAGLTRVKPEIALIPAGSANNVAHSFGIPLACRAAAKLAVEGRSKPIDLIEAVTPSCRHVTVEGISAGFLSLARSHYHEANSSHAAAALAAGARALAGFHPLPVRVMRGTEAEELMLAQLFVANLPLYAFGLHVAPGVDVTDGLLDVVAIEGRGRPELLAMVARLHHGTELERAEARHWRAAHVRIDTHGAVPVVADSHDLGPGPVELSVLPRELPLVRP